jgi:hypothetical protein
VSGSSNGTIISTGLLATGIDDSTDHLLVLSEIGMSAAGRVLKDIFSASSLITEGFSNVRGWKISVGYREMGMFLPVFLLSSKKVIVFPSGPTTADKSSYALGALSSVWHAEVIITHSSKPVVIH